MRKGFTLVELIVVIAMLMALAGSVTTAVAKARRRAKIASATAVCQEMTNAILAYENYSRDYTLSKKTTGKGENAWADAKEGSLDFILGREQIQQNDQGSGNIPVLFNAEIRNGMEGRGVVDPWGHLYQYKIVEYSQSVEETDEDRARRIYTRVYMPNYYRRQAGEDE